MKKLSTLIVLILVISSCKKIDEKKAIIATKKILITAKDSTVVNDKDENGCLASAGYVWSKVNKECVKVFSGIQLKPIDKLNNEDETLSVYVLFNEDASLAEIFLPRDTSSLVLNRSSGGKFWILKDWQLIPSKGYVLKQGNIAKFVGDGEIGKKEIQTDTEQ